MKDSPAVILYDEDGNPVDVKYGEGQTLLGVRDREQMNLLRRILHQLTKMNEYWALFLDATLEDEEAED